MPEQDMRSPIRTRTPLRPLDPTAWSGRNLPGVVADLRRAVDGFPIGAVLHGWGARGATELHDRLLRLLDARDSVWLVPGVDLPRSHEPPPRALSIILDPEDEAAGAVHASALADLVFFAGGHRSEVEHAAQWARRSRLVIVDTRGECAGAVSEALIGGLAAVAFWAGGDDLQPAAPLAATATTAHPSEVAVAVRWARAAAPGWTISATATASENVVIAVAPPPGWDGDLAGYAIVVRALGLSEGEQDVSMAQLDAQGRVVMRGATMVTYEVELGGPASTAGLTLAGGPARARSAGVVEPRRVVRTADGSIELWPRVSEYGTLELAVRVAHPNPGLVVVDWLDSDGEERRLLVPLARYVGTWQADVRLGPAPDEFRVVGVPRLMAAADLTAAWAQTVRASAPAAAFWRDEEAWRQLAETPGLAPEIRQAIITSVPDRS